MASATSYWERDLSRLAPKTKREYEYHLQRFLAWADLTHEGLYEKHKQSLDAEDARESDEVENLVRDFMTAMENGEVPDSKGKLKRYSSATRNQFLKSVASFFTSNKLAFSSKKLRERPIYRGVKRISVEEIRELHDQATGVGKTRDRNRALYLFGKDSGLRVSDIANLTVEQYQDARLEEIGGLPFRVFEPFLTLKTGDTAHAIVGAEAIHAVDKMLNGRTSGPLFLSDEGQPWSAAAMTAHMLYVRRTVFKNESRVSAHSMRKYHNTQLESAGVPANWIRLLQGKSSYVYSRPQDGPELLEAYARAYPSLRVLPSRHLENQVKDLRRKVAKLEELDQERVNEMRNEILDFINEARAMTGLPPAPRPNNLPPPKPKEEKTE